MQNQTPPLILTFGVTDPIGSVGIQADLASFAAMGCHGLSAITGILVSDTARIEDLQPVEPDWVSDQARVVLEDMPIAAFKIGVVGSIENASVIAEIVSDYPDVPLVIDPFGSSMPEHDENGDDLLMAIRDLLIPQATVLLLSAGELTRLAETWREPSQDNLLAADVMHLIESGCEYILVTGMPAALQGVANALFSDVGVVRDDQWERVPGSFGGAGATLSAVVTAMLANGLDVPEAIAEAQEFTIAALTNAHRLGMGRLMPDRYFWAREAEQDESGESTSTDS